MKIEMAGSDKTAILNTGENFSLPKISTAIKLLFKLAKTDIGILVNNIQIIPVNNTPLPAESSNSALIFLSTTLSRPNLKIIDDTVRIVIANKTKPESSEVRFLVINNVIRKAINAAATFTTPVIAVLTKISLGLIALTCPVNLNI